MRVYNPANDGGDEPTYRETTFVSRPGQTVRAFGDDFEAVAEPLDGDGVETEQLREEIEETRAELSVTVEAIQEKLKPATLADQAKEQAREVVRDVTEQARGNYSRRRVEQV